MIESKISIDNDYKLYIESLNNANLLIKEKEEAFNVLADSMNQLEENRVSFIKSLLTKQFQAIDIITSQYMEKSESISSIISGINPLIGCNSYLHGHSDKPNPFKLIQILPSKSYPSIAESCNESKSSTTTLGESEPEEINNPLNKFYTDLVERNTLDKTQESLIIEQFINTEGRNLFASILDRASYNPLILPEDLYKFVEVCCNTVLSEFINHDDDNYETLRLILESSRRIFIKDNNKEFLFLSILNNKIWKEVKTWEHLDRKSVV